MTTVDTIEDIIRVLREQPDVREEVRRLILTEELLALPAQFIEMRKDIQDIFQILAETQRALTETQLALAETQRTQAEHSRILASHTDDIVEIKNDLGTLKGLSAFAPAERRYGLIALELGLEPEGLLTPVEIARLSMSDAAQNLDQSALHSFRDSDLVISARASDGRLCYIAVEVSYTIGHSDIDRALKHAEVITLLTGAPAFPVVSGVRAAAVAEVRLNSDAIHWHQLPRKILDPR